MLALRIDKWNQNETSGHWTHGYEEGRAPEYVLPGVCCFGVEQCYDGTYIVTFGDDRELDFLSGIAADLGAYIIEGDYAGDCPSGCPIVRNIKVIGEAVMIYDAGYRWAIE
jgi:hypothetical protein